MPILVQRLIFTMIPERAPWLLRPLLRFVFGNVQNAVVLPRMKKHGQFVSKPCSRFSQNVSIDLSAWPRSRNIYRSVVTGLQEVTNPRVQIS